MNFRNHSREIGLVTAVYDYTSQVNSGTSEANAMIKTTAHVGIGYMAGNVGAAAGLKIGAALGTVAIPIPGVGTVTGAIIGAVAGFAIGVGLSIAGSKFFDTIYDEHVAERIDNGLKKVNEVARNVGDAVSGWFSSLGSAFS
ncbi:hypothetical protein [Streptococcus fryi]